MSRIPAQGRKMKRRQPQGRTSTAGKHQRSTAVPDAFCRMTSRAFPYRRLQRSISLLHFLSRICTAWILPEVSSSSQAAQRGMVQAHIRLCMTGHNSGYPLMPNFDLFFFSRRKDSSHWPDGGSYPSIRRPKKRVVKVLWTMAQPESPRSSEVFPPMVRNRGHTAYVTFFLPYASLLFVSIHP